MSDVLHPTPQTPEHVHEVPEHELHELPEGVVVPDDLSTLEGHEAPRRGPRWLYWLAGVVVVGAGAVILVSVLGDDGTEQPETPASDIVEANRTATLQDLAATEAAVTFDTSHIRDLTAEATASDIVEANRTATLQDLAATQATASDIVEANRVQVLQDLAATPATASDIVEANRTATLQDLAATEAAVTFDTSHIRDLTAEATASDIVEANRTATLQDLAAARSNPGPNADLPPDVVNN